MRSTLVVLTVLLSTPSLAQRLAIPEFAGGGGAVVRTQLVASLCDGADCVVASRVTTGGRPDLKKARKEGLQFFVLGAMGKRGKVRVVDLSVVAVGKTLQARGKKSLALDGPGLSSSDLQEAVEAIRAAMGATRAPEPARPPPVAAAPVAPPPPAVVAAPAPVKAVEAPAPPPARRPRTAAFLALEVGADFGARSFTWRLLTTPNLQEYQHPGLPLATVKVEVSPLALLRDDLLAGLGVDLGFGFAPWLVSKSAAVADPFPTMALRLDGALRWRLKPVPTFGLALIPFVGVRYQTFTIGATAGGVKLEGLPNLAYLGLRAGLAFEVPVIPSRLMVLARFAVIPVFSSGEILSQTYFPTGSTLGLEGSAGLAVQLAPFLQLRATFEYLQYALTFQTAATDRYVAAGALDQYIGGNAALRLEL